MTGLATGSPPSVDPERPCRIAFDFLESKLRAGEMSAEIAAFRAASRFSLTA